MDGSCKRVKNCVKNRAYVLGKKNHATRKTNIEAWDIFASVCG